MLEPRSVTDIRRRRPHIRIQRPLNVTIIGILILLQGLTFAILAGLTLVVSSSVVLHEFPPTIQMDLPVITLHSWLLVAAALVMGIFGLVSSVGVLRLRPWGWLMAMIAQGINLATELLNYTRGEAGYLNMVVSVVIVLYLNQRDVQQSFSVAEHYKDPAGRLTAQANHEAEEEAQREVVGIR